MPRTSRAVVPSRRYVRRAPAPTGPPRVARRFNRRRTFRRRPFIRAPLQTYDKMLVRLRFSLNAGAGHDITSTSGAVVDWVYRASDCYDPYAGAGGAQPRGFDQYMAFYRHGVVIHSRVVANFAYSESATVKYPFKCFVILSDSNTALANVANIAENSKCSMKTLTHGEDKATVTFTYSPKKFFSISKPLSEQDLYFSSSSSPTEGSAFHIGGYSPTGSTEEGYVTGFIDYTCVLIHPINPSAS